MIKYYIIIVSEGDVKSMLYGMDEFDEFGLIKKPKLNIKKVIIINISVLLCIILGFATFYFNHNNDFPFSR